MIFHTLSAGFGPSGRTNQAQSVKDLIALLQSFAIQLPSSLGEVGRGQILPFLPSNSLNPKP